MFNCTECEEVFTARGTVSRHFNTYIGLKFSWEDCSSIFTHKDTLNDHVQKMHVK